MNPEDRFWYGFLLAVFLGVVIWGVAFVLFGLF